MYTTEKMKQALGRKRWDMVQEYSFECGVIDIMFKAPWINPLYAQTVFVLEPFTHEMTKRETIEEIKHFMDDMVSDQKLWNASQTTGAAQ